MELTFYLLGNWSCIAGAVLLLLYSRNSDRQQHIPASMRKELLVSKDLQVMQFIGSIMRVYWSSSPPCIWSEEILPIKVVSILDVFVSPFVWGMVLHQVGMRQKKYVSKTNVTPLYIRWEVLTLLALFVGWVGSIVLPALDMREAWPFADVMVIANMILEGFAMIPQLYFLSASGSVSGDENHNTGSTSRAPPASGHFVGLLSLGRLLRFMFWGILIFNQFASGEFHGGYLWTFILPDLIHTIIMGDYLYVWMKTVKEDQIDPLFHSVAMKV